MEWLAENALPIWVVGAIALTMALMIYFQTRNPKAFFGAGLIIAVTAALLIAERLMETPREAVERTLNELAATVEANDIAGTLAYLAPSAESNIRSDVETLMPLVEIERARIIGSPQIEVEPGAQTATVQLRGFIWAKVKTTGMQGGQDDELTLTLVRRGDRWLVEDYTSKRNWHRALGRR